MRDSKVGAYTVLCACSLIGTAAFYLLSRVRRRRSQIENGKDESLSEEEARIEVALERIDAHARTHGKWITLEETDEFSNQVAGHTNEKMLTYKNLLLKPIIKPLYFWRELSLYNKLLTSGEHWTQSLKPFTASFSGVFIMKRGCASRGAKNELVPASSRANGGTGGSSGSSGSSGSRSNTAGRTSKNDRRYSSPASQFLDDHLYFLGLEDLSRTFYKPCVIDLKMGTQTYEPDADEAKKRKEVLKCPYQSQIGFRLTGLKVYDVRCNCYGWLSKHFGRSIMPSMAFAALALCFFDGASIRKDVVKIVIQKLERIHTWFKSQNRVHFYCSSILIVYEGYQGEEYSKSQYLSGATHFLRNLPHHFPPTHQRQRSPSRGFGSVKNDVNDFMDLSKALNTSAEDTENESSDALMSEKSSRRHLEDLVHVKMIDFAHVLPNNGTGLDVGYLKGLSNLITRLHQVMLLEQPDIDLLLLS